MSIVEPAAAVQQCIQLQVDILKECSADLSRYYLTSRAKAAILKSASNGPLKAAMLFLSSWGYELWEQESSESPFYHFEITEEEHNGEKVCLVYWDCTQSALPRKITKSGSKRCNYDYRIAYGIQCPHEPCVSGGHFVPHLWAP